MSSGTRNESSWLAGFCKKVEGICGSSRYHPTCRGHLYYNRVAYFLYTKPMKENLVLTIKQTGAAKAVTESLEPTLAFARYFEVKAAQKRVYPQVEFTGWHSSATALEEAQPVLAWHDAETATLLVVTPHHVYAQAEGADFKSYTDTQSALEVASPEPEKVKVKKDKKAKKKKDKKAKAKKKAKKKN